MEPEEDSTGSTRQVGSGVGTRWMPTTLTRIGTTTRGRIGNRLGRTFQLEDQLRLRPHQRQGTREGGINVEPKVTFDTARRRQAYPARLLRRRIWENTSDRCAVPREPRSVHSFFGALPGGSRR